jgi:hypothetical protein
MKLSALFPFASLIVATLLLGFLFQACINNDLRDINFRVTLQGTISIQPREISPTDTLMPDILYSIPVLNLEENITFLFDTLNIPAGNIQRMSPEIVTLLIDPQSEPFSAFRFARLFLSAEGQGEVMIASTDSISPFAGNRLQLFPTENNVRELLLEQTSRLQLRSEFIVRRRITQNVRMIARANFRTTGRLD